MNSMFSLVIFCFVIFVNETWALDDVDLWKNRKISCLFVNMRNRSYLESGHLVRQTASLVVRSWKQPVEDSFDTRDVYFIFKDSPINVMKFFKQDTAQLKCEINPYFTDNIQIIWPGTQINEYVPEPWFVARVKHPNNMFQVTVFFPHLSEKILEEYEQSQLHAFPNADLRHILPVFMLSTQTPLIQARLKQDVLLNCDFSIDHQASVRINWKVLKKGELETNILLYDGSTKILTYHIKGISMNMDEINKGSASIVVKSMTLENQGLYTCSVSVGPLFGDQLIHLEAVETPTVTLNVKSLLLEKGEEQKIVCEASNYYPLDVTIEWLQESRDQGLLPVALTNVLFSAHKNNRNGTFSLSSFFLLTASPQDDGSVFTCRVDHVSLKYPIKKTVKVRVKESITWNYIEHFLVILISVLCLLLLTLLKYLFKVKTSDKPKPY